MVSNHSPSHLPDLALNDVLEESSPDEIVKLPLVAGVQALVLADLVVEVVQVVLDVVSHDGRGPGLDFEDNVVSIFVVALAVNLRPQEAVSAFHVLVVVSVLFLELALDVLLLEQLVVLRQHLLHVLPHLQQHYVLFIQKPLL